MGDNGSIPRRRSYKKDQKNVSVYLGKATSWEAQVLEAICKAMDWKEAQFFRNLFFDYLAKQGLYNDITNEPNRAAIEDFKAKAAKLASRRMSLRLDLEEDERG